MILDNLDSVAKNFRNLLISTSQLDGQFVRNALSKFGTSLDKSNLDDIFNSISTNDSLLLFEIMSDDSDADMSETENNSISYFKSMKARIIIYGQASLFLALKISGNILTDVFRTDAQNKGLYLKSVDKPQTLTDFKNEVMWPRTDFVIKFSLHLRLQLVKDEETFEKSEIKGVLTKE